MSETVYLPIHPSEAAALSSLKPPPELSDEHNKMYKELLAHFSVENYRIPDVENPELTEAEKFWLSYECFCR
jgi:hypothetical protein